MAFKVEDLSPTPGSRTTEKRIGRGIGSGMGKTATRGHKGQEELQVRAARFEGRTDTLFRRTPIKGSRTEDLLFMHCEHFDSKRFESGSEISPGDTRSAQDTQRS